METKLDQLGRMTVVVADTADMDAVRRLKPQDCTTNPTLVLRAVTDPRFSGLLAEALGWGRGLGGSSEAVVSAIAQRLSVLLGRELSGLVPGQISTEVDADLSFDTGRTISQARQVIEAYEEVGVARERILVKVAATWEGIRAAEQLEREGIRCNLTLVFSAVQATACADAGVFLISPFVGRILDWHVKAGAGPFTAENDPGVASVRAIHGLFRAHGVPTVVMGASFRTVAQVEALAGCDRLTVSPALLDSLALDSGVLLRQLHQSTTQTGARWTPWDEAAFRFALNEDAMATEKLAEGVRLFAKDLVALRRFVAERIESSSRMPEPSLIPAAATEQSIR